MGILDTRLMTTHYFEQIRFSFVNIGHLYRVITGDFLCSSYDKLPAQRFELNKSLCWLNCNEVEKLNSFTTLKKQVEWLAGRYNVKLNVAFNEDVKALNYEKILPIDLLNVMSKIEIFYKEEGAPYVKNYPNINFSLSHSGKFSAAAFSQSSETITAIDLEHITEKNYDVVTKVAFTQKEIDAFNNISDKNDRIIYFYKVWTAKEAYLKLIGRGFHEPLKNITVDISKPQAKIFHHEKKMPVSILFSLYCEQPYSIIFANSSEIFNL